MTGEAGYAEALKRREALPAEQRARYKPYRVPARRDDATRCVAADLLVGRAGSSTLAEASALGLPHGRRARTRTPSAHQMANARALADAGAARIIADEDFDASALDRRCAILLDDAAASTRWRAPLAASAGPAPPTPSPSSCLALAERRRAARRRPRIDAASPSGARDRGAMTARQPRPRTSSPVSARTSSAASASRRRATSRWRASRPCASAARPTFSPRCTTCSSCAAIVRFARSPGTAAISSSDVAPTWSSATPACAAWSSTTAPSSTRFDGDSLYRRLGPADGQGGDAGQASRACPAWSSGWPSRARSAAPCGPTPARTSRTCSAVLVEAGVMRADGTEADARRRGPRPRLPRERAQARGAGRAGGRDLGDLPA